MLVLSVLLTFSYLESDSKAKIIQRLLVSSSLNVIADATGLRHTLTLAGCLTRIAKLMKRVKNRDTSNAEIYQALTRQ
jgi:hypothetical protein